MELMAIITDSPWLRLLFSVLLFAVLCCPIFLWFDRDLKKFENRIEAERREFHAEMNRRYPGTFQDAPYAGGKIRTHEDDLLIAVANSMLVSEARRKAL
jgi:hypothetical protein